MQLSNLLNIRVKIVPITTSILNVSVAYEVDTKILRENPPTDVAK
jgi:hypothetical protein